MRKLIIAALITCGALPSISQDKNKDTDGTSYYLPKTAIQLRILTEKSSFTPGEYAIYSERFLKTDAKTEESTAYRIIGMDIESIGIPDTSKLFTAKIDSKHTINSLHKTESGILLAVNTEAKTPVERSPFIPATKPALPDPRDFMTQEILEAGSKAKMAELTALEIYDTRESKNLLNKGQADFMPQDGEQLRIMLSNLKTQENALMQLFEGVTVKDTAETVITFVPEHETDKQMLFRFSKRLGIVDKDDLSGTPYYISIEDCHNIPDMPTAVEPGTKNKDDAGIYANLPGKIKLAIYNGARALSTYEMYSAQFGRTVAIQGELFSKKLNTELVFNPITGNVESIKTEMVKK